MLGKQGWIHFVSLCLNILGLIFNAVPVYSDHFRGGTISWRASSGNTVNFRFRLAYAIGKGPGCNKGLLGQSVTQLPNDFWECTTGCPSVRNITDVNYVCSSVDTVEAWEQGQDNFKYTFPTTGPFTVSYTGRTWLNVSYGQSGDFHLQTTGDLRTRSDTGHPNSSPLTASMPVFQVPFGCKSTIDIPMVDPDDDVTVCRWASGGECGTDCLGLPNATLLQSPCRIQIEPNVQSGFVENGWYKVLLTVEDLPKNDIFLEKTLTPRSQVLSTVPLQFVMHTVSYTTLSPCNIGPSILPPTPSHRKTILVPSNETLTLRLFAGSAKPYIRIKEFIVSAPYGISLSPLVSDANRTDVWYTELSWKPDHTVHPCDSGPCRNHGNCSLDLDTYKCTCPVGFTGNTCETDIDECSSNPCMNGGTCWNRIPRFVCFCPSGFIGNQCQDTDKCAVNPCQNFGTCISSPAGYNCTCLSGYTGKECQNEQDECKSNPCQNGGTCQDMVGGFLCRCPVKYTGSICQTEIDYCHPNPCQNGGVCTGLGSSYACACPGNYLGLNCERAQDKGCSSPTDSYCMCNVDGKPIKVPVPVSEARSDGIDKEDFVAGLIGFPIGATAGAIMAALCHYLLRPKCTQRYSRRGSARQPLQRPGSSMSTRSLIGRTSPVSPGGVRPSVITPKPLNVYRAGFIDPTSHKTGERLNDDSYLDGSTDW
ncbi:Sushi, von Willebrand factor type A, EGF and pentraxin domain-containing protein 1 [Mizuhopecten yessoensis]|uniref:Sushi, von Willebrand factor type A, EGF and pentraxin domain-containing protein 1 n=1 Tax=Mizuhopecten yessoensis TaxID=6573 RepID=A0A210QHW7_MIZYE|nr:Sushi, von Willebrand factor type A, EGF and pentraxin domain-containing protein 1 [Mizuhopecten yessoensis]